MPFSALPAALAEALSERGYAAPTAVQAAVLEPEAVGRDLIVSAQTGSGKTVAFGCAIVPELTGGTGSLPPPGEPLALVVAPTRELALQVQRELVWLYARLGARVATCVGGMDMRREQRMLQGGAHVVVGTPGRLRDHLERGSLPPGSLRAVVLDEADEMLDLGFRDDLEQILDAAPPTRRTLLFSATMPKPIVALATRYQRDALRIATTSPDRQHADIAYQAVAVAPADIEHAVVNLLRLHESAGSMVFCATRENVRRLHASLVERGFAAVALSGELSQNERNHALQALRDRRARVCVATDVAARGIDLPDLGLVIHAELPRDAETLQHRSGRTGRAGRKGVCVLVVPYTRRRGVERMLKGARIEAAWLPAPSPEMIRAKDAERMMAALLAPAEVDEEDRALAEQLLAQKDPIEIAAALVRSHRARLPEPEELFDGGSGQAQRADVRPDGPRPGFEDTIWFRLNIGRRNQADPRWILPLLCRRGHITKRDVGAIRIDANETLFEVPRAMADRFIDALKRTAGADDEGIVIEPLGGKPAAQRAERPRQNNGPNRPRPPAAPRHAAKPYRPGAGKRG